jgi:hypothetical protein
MLLLRRTRIASVRSATYGHRPFRIRSGRIAEPPVVFEAESDVVATERAKQLVDGCDVELWSEVRFVIGLRGSETKT